MGTRGSSRKQDRPYNSATGAGQNRTYIAGIYGTQLPGGRAVFVDAEGRLGTLGVNVAQAQTGSVSAGTQQALATTVSELQQRLHEQQRVNAEQQTTIAELQARLARLEALAARVVR